MSTNLAARIAAAALTFTPVASYAGECIAVGMDGLTARLVNPTGRVSGEVDATGCDIGVYYDRATGAVEGAEIHGARVAGVLVSGDARVGVEATTVRGLGAGAAGIEFRSASGAVSDCHLEVESGRGIVASGVGARVIAIGNRMFGGGLVAIDDAAMTVRENTVEAGDALENGAGDLSVVPVSRVHGAMNELVELAAGPVAVAVAQGQ